jgi:CBS domain containing-hemolysin-like protein
MHLAPETVDVVADYLALFVIIFVPGVLIALFWMVHILPEKVAYQRGHPQADAIKTLCLLSLVFGGLLWPLAWLWAYSKPVMYKLAYGTDRVEHPGHETEVNGVAVSGDLPLGPTAQPRNDLTTINSLPGEH